MKLMMVCPACLGTGEYMILDECPFCKGDAIIDPPKQILDDLECAEIKREFKNKQITICTKVLYFSTRVDIPEYSQSFFGQDELEALRKAKAWLDGRGE